MENSQTPIVLFAFIRPLHLTRTLACLKKNRVPLIYAFSDGPLRSSDAPKVQEVRKILRSINWCEIRLTERETNLGLGRSVLAGVTEVLRKHESAIIFEDDLICVPGTYEYLCSALDRYQEDPMVMSVTGWTHPLVTPRDVTDQPYFDGRAECWVWGTWARAWKGMETDAKTLIKQCLTKGIDIYEYGADLVDMAERELTHNIWAVRFLYWHILNRGLCLRPPWTMVDHIGFGDNATNATDDGNGKWSIASLRECPVTPNDWVQPHENPECAALWRKACGAKPSISNQLFRFGRRSASQIIRFLRG